jgi:hypothetical protein
MNFIRKFSSIGSGLTHLRPYIAESNFAASKMPGQDFRLRGSNHLDSDSFQLRK